MIFDKAESLQWLRKENCQNVKINYSLKNMLEEMSGTPLSIGEEVKSSSGEEAEIS